MTALVEVAPVHDVVGLLGVLTDGHVLGEAGHSGRHRARRRPLLRMHALVVEVRRGACGRGEPVDHHVGEDVVAVDRVLGQVVPGVRPLLELLHDPGELTDRRVGEAVGQGQRPGRGDLEVAVALGHEPAEALQSRLLHVAERLRGLLVHLAERDEPYGRCVHVYADHPVGIHPAEIGRHERAEVAALGAVPLVAESAHQLGQCAGHPAARPAGLGDGTGEAESGQRRDHQVERVGRVTAVGAGVAERPDHVEELHDRAGPAVDQQQRSGIGLRGPDVQEVEILPVDLGGELGELVEASLRLAPVVAVPPVFRQALEVVHGHAAGPRLARALVGPAGQVEAGREVVECGLRDVDPVRRDPCVGHGLPCLCRNGMLRSV